MRKISLYIISFLTAVFLSGSSLPAQSFSVSTNIVDWCNLGTLNLEAGTPLGQHWSIHAEFRYNPWLFGAPAADARYDDIMDETRKSFRNGKTAINLNLRWWSWHVYSGWWVRAKVQYMAYDRGGLFHKERSVGDSFGVGIGGGYTWMLSDHWNLEAGLAGWGGYTFEYQYPSISDPHRSETVGKWFILPDQLIFALVYIF